MQLATYELYIRILYDNTGVLHSSHVHLVYILIYWVVLPFQAAAVQAGPTDWRWCEC